MTLKDVSRTDITPGEGSPYTTDRISTGSLQRIADAVEKMAGSYGAIVDERDRYKTEAEYQRERAEEALRRVSALKGVITRLKRRSADA